MAIKTDGSLWGWGMNYHGEVGNGTDDRVWAPVKIMDDVSFVSVGAWHTIAIKTDGSLWSWGQNEYAQLG